MIFVWVGFMVVGVAEDQIALIPPSPPTPAQSAAARPAARARWAVVYQALSARLPSPPPEVGEVWANRTGRICGYVDDRESAVDNMTRFYTDHRIPVLPSEDERRFLKVWIACINDRWVVLHDGTETTGFCATQRGRHSVIGGWICAGRP